MYTAIHNTATKITVILTNQTTGRPMTGLVPSDLMLYYRKHNGLPMSQTPVMITELNASTMPGMYEVEFTASEMDTLGEFVAVISAGKPLIDVEHAYISLRVVPTVETEILNPLMMSINYSLSSVKTSLEDSITASTTTITSDLDEIKGAGFHVATDSLEAIRDHVNSLHTKLDDLINITKRVLGLSNENYQITDQVYNADGQLVNARINLYESAADLALGTPVWEAYDLLAQYHPPGHSDEGKLSNYTIARRP